jgi:polysaccharide biosynthesis protein PslH
MRILYLAPWFPYPLDTGSRIRIYYLLRALARQHQVSLFTLDPSGWAPAQVDGVTPLCERVAVVKRDLFRPGPLRSATRFLSLAPVVAQPVPEMQRVVRQAHADRPFDVIIAATTFMAAYAVGLPNVCRVLEEHNCHTRWMHERFRAQTSVVQRVRCWASWRKSAVHEARLFPRFDLISMVSTQDANVTRSLLHGQRPPVEILPNGVDCTRNRPGLAVPIPGRLVFNGSLAYQANYDAMQWFLVEVYPTLQRLVPDLSLTITGSIDGVDLSRLALDPTVQVTGYLEDVRPTVAQASVCVVPIREGGGTRLKILEAMALGTPVVATRKGAEGLDVSDGKHLMLADDPARFIESTLRILQDPGLRNAVISNGRSLVEASYNWEAIGERFVQLIEGLGSGMPNRVLPVPAQIGRFST